MNITFIVTRVHHYFVNGILPSWHFHHIVLHIFFLKLCNITLWLKCLQQVKQVLNKAASFQSFVINELDIATLIH